MSELLQSRVARVAVPVIVIAIAVGWFFVKNELAKREVYEGTILQTYKQRDWLRGFRKHTRSTHRYYDYYWQIRCPDGAVRNVEVTYGQWSSGKAGDPVKKAAGQRWPYIDTPEAARAREVRDEAVGAAVDGVKRKILGNE